ncbi:MAG: PKD domain-containing protein [Nocardioidaceae bacterium]
MRRLLIAVLAASMVVLGLTNTASGYELAQGQVASARPASFTPNVLDGRVNALARVGQTIVVGGTFTQVQAAGSTTTLVRNYIFAFDKDTGAISTTFVPQLDNEVESIAAGPNNTVYIGGKFNSVNGTSAYKVTQLNVADGSRVSSFRPGVVNALVQDVKYSGGRLFIGGQFTKIGVDSRSRLAELDPTTGAVLSSLNLPVTGAHFGGAIQIWHMDVSPDGSKLIIVGNFIQVAGQDRVEAALINLATNPATLANWETEGFKQQCYSVFHFIVRDAEFSPDGSYFVIGTTGGYGSGSPSLCDSISRWDSSATGTGIQPTWVDYTGGDSTYTVTPTGSAIYYGGHERWVNNPSAADAAGPGAVPRAGIGALDPTNGLPLNWNPGRSRGQGVFAMLATPEGLFVGSDTDRIGNQIHRKLAFFPLTGGHVVPQPAAPALPVQVYSLGTLSSATNVLYRVDAGGPQINALDGGPNWAADTGASPSPYQSGGSSTAQYSTIGSVNSSVPPATPIAIFSSERWGNSSSNEMHWSFPVPVGENVGVRLYFANQYSGTSQPGQRVFNVSIDGQPKLVNYDIVADAGNQTGEMKSFNIVSDGTVNIDFSHVLENPLIDGIELINLDAPPPPPSGSASSRLFTGTSAGASAPVSSPGIDWSTVRGAVLLDGTLYTTWADGTLRSQSFDGSTFGPMSTVNLYGLTQFSSDVQAMTGMFYDNGRLYFTKAGSSTLYMRYFSTDLPVVGAGLKDLQAFQVSQNVSGVDWSKVQGMFLAGGELYWVNGQDGSLNRIDWVNGAPVAGTGVVISGPGIDGIDWRAHALFDRAAPANQPPVAKIVTPVDCSGLTCKFDGSQSTDADGSIASYSWNFGDNSTSTDVSPSHTYATPGNRTVTLQVSDSHGATGTTSVQVNVAATNAITFVDTASDSQAGSTKAHSLVVPGDVQVGDVMLLKFSDNSSSVTVNPPAGWTQQATENTSGAAMTIYSRVATSGDPGSMVKLTTSGAVRGDLELTAYRGTASTNPVDSAAIAGETVRTASHTTPTAVTSQPGSLVVSMWTDKTTDTTTWSAPSGQQVRYLFAGTGAGHMSALVTDGGAQVAGGSSVGGLTAIADSATGVSPSAQALMATVVLNAGP